MKAYIGSLEVDPNTGKAGMWIFYYSSSIVFNVTSVGVDITSATTQADLKALQIAAATQSIIDQGYSMTIADCTFAYNALDQVQADWDQAGSSALDFIKNKPTIPTILARSFNNAPGRSLVTGTGATGFQVSSTRDSFVTYSPKIVTTATIAGGQDGYTVLEIAATNSATAGDWKEIGRVENGQALSLALTLQSVQPVGASLTGMVPTGWYAKLRTVNVTGTPTFSYVSGQEVLL